MRSPAGAFDLRSALTKEVQAAIDDFNTSPETAVHACRVRLKRARALARVGHAGAPGLASVFDDTARTIMRTLATARTPHALAQTARKFAKKLRGKQARAFEAAALAFESAEAPPLNLEAANVSLKDLLALAQVWPEASARQIKRGARRVSGKARRAFRRAHAATDETLRHAWRKREQDRLFAALILKQAWPGRRQRKVSEKLGETLGRERDAMLLLKHMQAAPVVANEEDASARAVRTLRKRHKRLARQADKIGARLHRSRD